MVYEKPWFELKKKEGDLPSADPLYHPQGVIWAAGTHYDDQENLVPSVAIALLMWFEGKLIPAFGHNYPLGEDLDEEPGSELPETRFWTTHLLMQQTLAWIESQHPPRALRRQGARRGLPASRITVVKLRKIEKAPDKESGDMVAWTHRWLVNGHWRQHWYPSTSEHRPMWIAPHVKGPADKPFIAKDRVIAWVR